MENEGITKLPMYSKEMRFKQIALSPGNDEYPDRIYGLTNDGVVWFKDMIAGSYEWHKVSMQMSIVPE